MGGYGLYTVALTHLPASVINLVATIEPVFTAAIAYVVLHERLNSVQIIGSLLILSGVVLLRIYDGWMEKRAKARTS